jgi:hypothetical protein
MVTERKPTVEEEFTAFMRATQPKVLVALTAGFGPDACNDTTCASAVVTTVDSTGDVGQHTSLVLDASGNPIISY